MPGSFTSPSISRLVFPDHCTAGRAPQCNPFHVGGANDRAVTDSPGIFSRRLQFAAALQISKKMRHQHAIDVAYAFFIYSSYHRSPTRRVMAMRFRAMPVQAFTPSAPPVPTARGATGKGPSSVAGLFVILILFNIAAWAWALEVSQGRPALLGAALLAWVFGLRHAVDADHIAAIDNTVRKLMQEGRPALSVGFFFSLGHSTVVALAAAAIAAAAGALHPLLETFKLIGETIGTSVSAAFLLVI